MARPKNNNASCAINPFLRLFDARFGLGHVRNLVPSLVVTKDGFEPRGHRSMREISRDQEDLVAQTIGAHHQYADGVMLSSAPCSRRRRTATHPAAASPTSSATGWRSWHQHSDRLVNRVTHSQDAPPWRFGIGALMRNLSERGLS